MEGMPSYGTIRRILKESKFHPYVLQLRQQLRLQDHQRRIEHAHAQLALMEADADFLGNLLFSDKAHFHVHGTVNKQNFRYWSNSNQHWFREEPLHSPRVTVWAAIGRQGVVGPVFFDGNVNAAKYLAMLQEQFLPIVEAWSGFDELTFPTGRCAAALASCCPRLAHSHIPESVDGAWVAEFALAAVLPRSNTPRLLLVGVDQKSCLYDTYRRYRRAARAYRSGLR
uniref:Transposase n=1 Tax=Plectus sambesii TaxID=2011161 RepID=A0A914WUE5_9BILA